MALLIQPKANLAGKGMRLMQRDRAVIQSVVDYQTLTREQLTKLGHFNSKTRANAVLLRLVRFAYLSRRYLPSIAGTQKALYFPGPNTAGVIRVRTDAFRELRKRTKTLSDLFLEHQLLVNDVRLRFECDLRKNIERWITDTALRDLQLGLVPDGYVEFQSAGKSFAAFLELDRGTETLERWSGKVRAYLELARRGTHRETLGRQYFRVIVVAPSAARLENLRKATVRLTDRIFWFTDHQRLLVGGPFADIWLRSAGVERHELTEP